jgi:hypothetical protein
MRTLAFCVALGVAAASAGTFRESAVFRGTSTLRNHPHAKWRTLKSRGGWRIKYPSSWVVWSCKSCPDPTAPGVYVSFGLPLARDGFVMVQPLAEKRLGQGTSEWLAQVKKTANLNPIESESALVVNGLEGLRVRYKNGSAGIEMEATYFVAGSKTYSISFAGEGQPKRLEDLPNYSLYLHMVETFEADSVEHERAANSSSGNPK